MTTNQHDSVARTVRYANHIAELCRVFHVMHEVSTAAPHCASAGTRVYDLNGVEVRVLTINAAPVTDETTYAVALHELGHLLAPLGRVDLIEGSLTYRTTGRPGTLRDVRLSIEAERAAWEWAHDFALEWTEVMTYVETFAMATYLKDLARY